METVNNNQSLIWVRKQTSNMILAISFRLTTWFSVRNLFISACLMIFLLCSRRRMYRTQLEINTSCSSLLDSSGSLSDWWIRLARGRWESKLTMAARFERFDILIQFRKRGIEQKKRENCRMASCCLHRLAAHARAICEASIRAVYCLPARCQRMFRLKRARTCGFFHTQHGSLMILEKF